MPRTESTSFADGSGRTIVIVDAFHCPTIQNDLDLFDRVFEVPASDGQIVAPDGLTPFDQNDANQVGWAGEITLDVEWAHAVARARSSPSSWRSPTTTPTSCPRPSSRSTTTSVTSSRSRFGEAEQCVDPAIERAQHRMFAKATLKGITLLASSGDQGAAQPSCDGSTFIKAASSPASDPLVTGVGGTLLDADHLTGVYHSETTWNEPQFEAGTGGGFSVVYGTPVFQKNLHLPSRGVPDVAYNAGINSGVLAAWSSSGLGQDLFFRFGGTSAVRRSGPGWSRSRPSCGTPASATSTRRSTCCRGPSRSTPRCSTTSPPATTRSPAPTPRATRSAFAGFPARRGWDPATGLGTPKANTLVPVLGGKLP